MKPLIISISFLFLFAFFSVAPTLAQIPDLSLYQAAEKTQYRLKFETGKEYYMQTITEQQISDPTVDQEQTTVMTVGTGAKLDVNKIDANGNAQVTYTYKWIKIGIKGATEEKVYDSSKKDSTVPKELQWFSPLLEESLLLTITPEGRISEIKELEKVRSNVRQKLPQGPLKEIAMSSLNRWLDEQSLSESIENSIAIYPDKPVGVGDSWSRNVTYSSKSEMIFENKWTLRERKNGVAIIEVASTIKPNPQAKPTEMGSPGMTSSSEFSGNQKGIIEIQESTGLIIKSKITQQMSGQNTITRPGVPDKVTPMEIKGVITVETLDWDKAKSIVGTNAVAERQPRREIPYAQPERPQRRAGIYAKSAAQPYPIDDEEEEEEEYAPVRPRQLQRNPTELIHQAVVDGNIDQVQQLLSQGADINSQNRMGWSLLRTAIQNRQQAVVEFLIAKGADVSAKDNSGQTPLLVAVNTGQKNIVELLITKGADVNVMGGRGDNALSLAKKRRNTEIVELLLEHGAKEPSLEDMMGDRYEDEGLYPGYEDERMAQRPTRTISPIVQQPVYVDILADPNEIKARIKTFEGLEKALAEVASKSQSEMRQWQQNRYDNRTLLIRTVEKQFEDEIGFVRKVAVEEKAKKTTAAIDSLLSKRQERLKKVSRELLEQKRAQRQTQAPTRGRSRSSGRSTRGRYPQSQQLPGGGMEEPYAERYDTMPGTSRYQGARRPPEPVDRETENEIRLWTQATIDKRAELAKGVHEQIRIDISPIRNVAVEEEAKKTTAAIDGLLLYRQMRFDEFIKKTEEEQRALQQTQDPRGGRYGDPTGRYPQSGRYRGRTPRGGTAEQDQYGQQGQQPRRRRR